MRAFPLLIFSHSNFLNLTFCTKIITHKHVITLFTFLWAKFHGVLHKYFKFYAFYKLHAIHALFSRPFRSLVPWFFFTIAVLQLFSITFTTFLVCYQPVCVFSTSFEFSCVYNSCLCWFRFAKRESDNFYPVSRRKKIRKIQRKGRRRRRKVSLGARSLVFPCFFSRFEPRHISARASETCDGPIF